MDTRSFYENKSTINTFNTILGGRWHTGYTPTIGGQLQIEETICERAKLSCNDAVLDFGSGCGLVTLDYYVMTGARIIGLTNSYQQTAHARSLRDKQQITKDHVHYIYSDSFNTHGRLPFKSDSFSKILFTESVCHVADKAGLFHEFNRILKKGGILCGEDWFTDSENGHPAIEKAYHIPRLSTLHMYGEMCQDAGFTVISSEKIRPVWESTWGSLLGSLWYKLKYPHLVLLNPLNSGQDSGLVIDPELIQSGLLLEKGTLDGSFYIGIVTAIK